MNKTFTLFELLLLECLAVEVMLAATDIASFTFDCHSLK